MTIKEIETLSGLSRANIRYYESEGLLEPKRSGNGYRDYSDADLTALLRIRLLRSLDFSLEDIRALRKMDLYGAIIGKAYYTGAIELATAIREAK